MADPPKLLTYTPALDGLRTLAVVAVFLVHCPTGTAVFTGGHLGVDVFLVLSGFLITSILAREHHLQGAFSIPRFYVRRGLRLLPALVVVVATVLMWNRHLGLVDPAGTRGYLWSLCLYYVNLRMLFHGAVPMGLMHTWSLSLEEQFYLLWPIMLGFLLRRSFAVAFRTTVALAVGLTAWECLLSMWDASSDNLRLFFCLDTRANAPLLGAALALIPYVVSPATRAVLEERAGRWTGGALAVLVASFILVPHTNFGLHQPETIPAILASAVLVAALGFGGPSRWRRGFEHPWMVSVGRVSYAFYLWHLPVLVYCAMTVPVAAPVAAFGLSLALSFLSYRMVESPFLRLKTRFG